MKKTLLLIGFLFAFAFGYSQTYVIRPWIDAWLLNNQLSTYYLDTTSTAQTKAGQLTLEGNLVLDNAAIIDNAETDTLTFTETVVQVDGILNIIDLKTATTTVLTPTSAGDVDTLETADIGDIAIDHPGGMTVVTTEGMMTINTGGTFEKLDEGNIAYTAYHLHDFTHDDGKLTYTGTVTKHFEICVHVSIEGDESAQRVLIRLAKDGSTIAGSEMPHDFKAVSTDAVISLGWLLELATGEYLEVFGTSDTSSDTFDVHNLQMIISEH